MVMPPGSHCDLDALVDAAIAQNTPNTLVDPESTRPWESTLLVAVSIAGRLDLADRLFSAGAEMSASDFSHVLWWSCNASEAIYLLGHGVPQDSASLALYIEPLLRHETWETIFVMLDYGADIETPFHLGAHLLHVAARQGTSHIIRELLRRGAAVDSLDGEGLTPLMKACDMKNDFHRADAESVYWLLKQGADPNAQTPDSVTPLLLCTREKLNRFVNRTEIAQMLLRFGANPNTALPEVITALMFAARDNDTALTRSLLCAGADPSYKTLSGRTARDIAEKHGSSSVLALLT